jgi:hypothetical protein
MCSSTHAHVLTALYMHDADAQCVALCRYLSIQHRQQDLPAAKATAARVQASQASQHAGPLAASAAACAYPCPLSHLPLSASWLPQQQEPPPPHTAQCSSSSHRSHRSSSSHRSGHRSSLMRWPCLLVQHHRPAAHQQQFLTTTTCARPLKPWPLTRPAGLLHQLQLQWHLMLVSLMCQQ